MNDGAIALLTCDFKDDYKVGDTRPATVIRFYTETDLVERLVSILNRNGCTLFDEPSWKTKPDFLYQGYTYSFATFVFRKE